MKAKQKKAPIVTPVVVTEVASVATKLTKRNTTPTDKALVATDKAQLERLEPLQDAKCVSPQAFLSYMLRRGYLAVKQD